MRGRKVHEVETKWRTAPRTDDVVSRRFKFGGPKSPRAAFKDPLAHTLANSSLRTPAHTRFIVSRPNFSILLRAILLGVSVHRGVCEWTSCACFLPKSAGAPGRRQPTGPMSGRHLCAGCGSWLITSTVGSGAEWRPGKGYCTPGVCSATLAGQRGNPPPLPTHTSLSPPMLPFCGTRFQTLRSRLRLKKLREEGV